MAGKKGGKKKPTVETPEQVERRAAEGYKRASGTPRRAAVCGDGISIAKFEEMSRKASGKGTLQEWRDAVVEALAGAKKGDKLYEGGGITQGQADMFHEVADALSGKTPGTEKYTSTAQLENLLTGKVKGLEQFGNIDPAQMNNPKYKGWTNYYPTHRMPMWQYLKQKGLADQAYWQHETKASFVSAGKKVYVDPLDVPYVVGNGEPGTFVKITAPNGQSTYARILESGTTKAEVSLRVWKNLGYNNVTTAAEPEPYLKVQTFPNSGGFPKLRKDRDFDQYHFNNDEIQRAGKLIEDGKVKRIDTRDDLKRAEGGGNKQASADPAAAPSGGGGLRLEKGFQTVAIGKNMRRVGYANAECLHEGGGYVLEGSATVYVGKYPFARIGDMTSDELAVETGDETVLIGGAPSSAQLA